MDKIMSEIYSHNFEFALANKQVEDYRNSLRRNIACRNEIEHQISECYEYPHFHYNKAADAVIAAFGVERVMYVLANTIQSKPWDLRFSRSNSEWAKGFTIWEKDTTNNSDHIRFLVSSHSTLVDALVTEVRKRCDSACNGEEG